MESNPADPRGRGYTFGPFVADAVRLRLWKDGRLVPLTTKPFEVLLVLLQHRDRVVSKDELLDRVWPNTTIQENNLARQIATLRRVLGSEDPGEYIVTVAGKGYRFVAPAGELRTLPAQRYLPAVPSIDPPLAVSPPLADADDSSDDPVVDTVPHAASGPSRRVGLGEIVAAASIVLMVLAGMWAWPSGGAEPSASQPALRRVTFDEAAVPRGASWAPDGQWIVYVSDRAGSADLWKQRVGDPDPVRLTASAAIESQPAWSPDGRSIVFRSERDGGGLYLMAPDGSGERLLSSFGHDPAWSPDGSRILFKRSVTIPDLPANYFVVSLDGTPPRQLRPDVLGQFASLHAVWHPDPDRVSIWGTRRGDATRRFLTVPIDGGVPVAADMVPVVEQELERLTPGAFVWNRSGRFVYFEATTDDTRNVWRVTVDADTGTWIDGPDRLTTGTGRESDLEVSPDGTRLLFTSTSSRTGLWAFPFDAADGRVTGQPFPVSRGSTGEVDFDADASGVKVAYRAVRAGRHELWESQVSGGEDRLLLSSPHLQLVRPIWSPDGAQLAFSRKASARGATAIGVMNLDGTGDRVLTESADVEMLTYDWSSDGRYLLGPCRFRPTDRYSTCLIAAEDEGLGDPHVQIIASDPTRNLFNPRFSPDQRWISFLAHDLSKAATSTVFVAPSAGGPWQAITEGTWFDDKPRWSPDGRVLYFVSNREGMANVWGRRFDRASGTPAGEVFPVTSFRSAQFEITHRTVSMEIAVTPRHLILPMSESRSEIWMLEGIGR
ncbi:MAG: PD40 domain-containing protein [Acidobacteria bacterium]|nr:PD40 domain-containing protein [Acidobacteriota bacterium]